MVDGLVAEDLDLVDMNRGWGGVAEYYVCDVEGGFVDVGLCDAWVADVYPFQSVCRQYIHREPWRADVQRQCDNQHHGRKDEEVHPPPLLEVGADTFEKASRCDGLSADVLDVAFVGHLSGLDRYVSVRCIWLISNLSDTKGVEMRYGEMNEDQTSVIGLHLYNKYLHQNRDQSSGEHLEENNSERQSTEKKSRAGILVVIYFILGRRIICGFRVTREYWFST